LKTFVSLRITNWARLTRKGFFLEKVLKMGESRWRAGGERIEYQYPVRDIFVCIEKDQRKKEKKKR
tara:strand:- start:204 stop:401 length:198 start_codon:yes stop_codon:yes gene_type:complete